MAAISSKKLLPSTEKKEKVFLVPYTNIVPSTPKLGGVKPAEVKEETAKTSEVNEKLSEVVKFFRYSLLLKERDKRRKRREQERKRFEESENKLEEKRLGKKYKQETLAAKIPGSSIFDRLARFTGFTLLGFVFNNFSNLLPKLNKLGAIIKPVAAGVGFFAESILSGTIEWIDKGYKAYDAVGKIVKDLGGENYERRFKEFSGALNVFLNTAILTGLAGVRGDALKKGTDLLSDSLKRTRRLLGPGARAQALGAEAARRANEDQFRKFQAVRRAQRKQQLTESLSTAGQRIRDRRRQARELAQRAQKRTGGIEGGAQTVRAKRIQEKVFMTGDVEPSRQRPKKARGPRKIESGVRVSDLQIQKGSFLEEVDDITNQKILRPARSTNVRGIFKEVTIPGSNSKGIPYGTKRFPPDLADTIEFIAKKYGAGSPQVRRAFESPEFYKYEITKAYRAMMNERLAPSRSGVKPPTRKRITAPRPPRKPPTPISGQIAKPRGPLAGLSAIGKKVGGFYKRIPLIGRIPVLGPLIDVIISLALGDPLERAVVAATSAAAFSGLFGFLGTLGFPFVGTAIGVALGGFVGDTLGRFVYDRFKENQKIKKYNQGGVVASRQIKSETKPKEDTIKTISPVGLQSRFSENDLKTLYGDSVGILAKISGIMSSPGGFIGSLMSSSINLLFGQKFSDRLLSYIRQTFGRGVESNVRSTVNTVVRNLELYLAFNQKTKKKSDEEQESDKNLLDKIVEFFRGSGKTDPPPADSDSPPVDKTFLNMKGGRFKKLRRIRGDEDTTDAPNASDPYVYDDGSILKPGMEVGSLQMTPTYAKHMEFTYAIQPVMVG